MAKEPEITATMIPHADLALAVPPPSGSHRDATNYGFNAIQDLWKRDALKRDPPFISMPDKVVIERGQF
jgi:hypothetical protein